MKKLLAFLLVCVMAFALVSCGGGSGDKATCTTCVDNNGDKICDVCKNAIKDEGKKPEDTTPAAKDLTVADFANAVKAMNATRVDIKIVTSSDFGSLTDVYKVAFGNGDRATISYTREIYDLDDPFTGDKPATKLITGTVEYANGSYTGDMSGAADAVAKVALNLSADKLASVQINGSQLIASVPRANASAVLGVALPADAILSVTMNAGGQSISAFTLSYADGANKITFSALYQ